MIVTSLLVLLLVTADGACNLNLPTCLNVPCSCGEVLDCNSCNPGSGCSQCDSGFFKESSFHQCVGCQDTFGVGCLHCADETGCQQCAIGYWKVWDPECGLFKCRGEDLECNSYTNEGDCSVDATCEWVSNTIDGMNVQYCQCDAAGDQDVVIVMDASGSVSNANFVKSEEFVRSVIRTGITPTSRVAIVQFSTSSIVIHHLDDSQDEVDLIAAVTNSRQFNGLTYTDLAIDLALQEFEDHGNVDNKLIILITDGQSQNGHDPCDVSFTFENDLEANNIIVSIIQIGSFDLSGIDCLPTANNEAVLQGEICSIDDFDELGDILGFVNELLCVDGDRLGCPTECTSDPCECHEIRHCKTCHAGPPNQGCSECENEYFFKDSNYHCENCQGAAGEGCMFCNNLSGCGQCSPGYNMVMAADNDCGINICEADCAALFGNGCLDCNNYYGCTDCDSGYIAVFDDVSGLWECELDGSNCPRHRKPWHESTPQERQLYIDGFLELHTFNDGKIPTLFANSHIAAGCYQAHCGSAFLPWHRYYIWEIETQIRNLGGKYACFGMPYWDWGHDSLSAFDTNIFETGLSDRGDSITRCVTDPNFDASSYTTPHRCAAGVDCCLERNSGSNRPPWVFRTAAELVSSMILRPLYSSFSSWLENVHGSPHVLIGGNMGNFGYSPDDPIFYLHHTYVDFVWAVWQDCHDYDEIEPNILQSVTDAYTDGGNSNDALDFDLLYNIIKDETWSHINQFTPTPRKMHDITDWNVIYDRGTFWDEGLVCEFDKCANRMNNEWFTGGVSCPERRRTQSSCHIDLQQCTQGTNNVCSCGELDATTCQFCNEGSGCGQCQSGNFKKSNNHQCIDCQATFGIGCLFCQDNNGCGQCDTGYTKEYSSDCGVFICKSDNPTPAPTPPPSEDFTPRIAFISGSWDNINAQAGLTQYEKEVLFSDAVCQYAKQLRIDNNLDQECTVPANFENCNDMPINPQTNDIDITLDQLLAKTGVAETPCLQLIRTAGFEWATGNHILLELCNGLFDPRC